MVHDTRVGKMRTKTPLSHGLLGLTLLLGLCGPALAGERGARDRAMFSGRRGGDAYVLTRGGHGTSASTSLGELVELKQRFSGEFLWARRGGKKILIRDRAVLDQAQALFEPLRALEPERRALKARQREIERDETALERKQEELDRREEDLEDENGENAAATREELKRRQDALRPGLKSLESRERDLERAERALDEREAVLEKKAEEQLWRLIDAALARGAGERVDAR